MSIRKLTATAKLFRKIFCEGRDGFTPEEKDMLVEMVSRTATGERRESRALSTITGTAGAYAIPDEQMQGFTEALKRWSAVADVATIVPTESAASLPWPTINDTGNNAGNPAENTQSGSATDPTFGRVNFNAYTFDSGIVLMPLQLLGDSGIDIEPLLFRLLAIRCGRKLNTKCTTGSGSSEPMGIVTAATAGVTTAGATAITYNELVDLEMSVDAEYRVSPGCGFMCNDAIFKYIRRLVDTAGRPIFLPCERSALQTINGKPIVGTINGYPVSINPDMASAVTTGLKTILFGALDQYHIRMQTPITLNRLTERYADYLQVGYQAVLRADGNLVDAGTHPVKYLVQA